MSAQEYRRECSSSHSVEWDITTSFSGVKMASQSSEQQSGFVSEELFDIFHAVIDTGIIFVMSGFGIITNSLTIRVFWQQGAKDGVNISMTAIAFWDLLKCLCAFLLRLYGPIRLLSPAHSWSWRQATSVYLDYTPLFAGYVSYVLATYVSIERCLCVTIPFKVKSVFTPRFTLFMVIVISVLSFGAYFVMYFIYDIVWMYNPVFNTSVAYYQFSNFYTQHGTLVMAYYKAMAIALPFSSFIILCVSSFITIHVLRKSTISLQENNEEKTTSTLKISQRNKQVTKMLTVVIAVYIGNLFPRIIFYIGSLIEPEFFVLGRYNNIFLVVGKCIYILDFINASVNLFIFVSMSSSFRATFVALLPCAVHFVHD